MNPLESGEVRTTVGKVEELHLFLPFYCAIKAITSLVMLAAPSAPDDNQALSLEQALEHGNLSLHFRDGRSLKVHRQLLFISSVVLRTLFQDMGMEEAPSKRRRREEDGQQPPTPAEENMQVSSG